MMRRLEGMQASLYKSSEEDSHGEGESEGRLGRGAKTQEI